MAQSFQSLLAVFVFAMFVESVTEYFFSGVEVLKPYLHWIALALGVIICVLYGIDIFKMLLNIESPVPYVGMILTGIIISRGANYLNDFVTSWGKGGIPVITNTVTTPTSTTTSTVVNPQTDEGEKPKEAPTIVVP